MPEGAPVLAAHAAAGARRGRAHRGTQQEPQLVEGLLGLPVASVCCGGQHAAVLTRDGDVYTWGRGGFGRLGHGDVRSLKAPRDHHITFLRMLGKTVTGDVQITCACGCSEWARCSVAEWVDCAPRQLAT